jgi:hypothetical protein
MGIESISTFQWGEGKRGAQIEENFMRSFHYVLGKALNVVMLGDGGGIALPGVSHYVIGEFFLEFFGLFYGEAWQSF